MLMQSRGLIVEAEKLGTEEPFLRYRMEGPGRPTKQDWLNP